MYPSAFACHGPPGSPDSSLTAITEAAAPTRRGSVQKWGSSELESPPGPKGIGSTSSATLRTGTPSDSRAASSHFAGFVGAYLDERSAGIVEAVSRAADGLGWTPLEVALSWVRDRPGVTAPVIGARTAAQLRGALGVEDLVLPDEIRSALDDVSAE